MADMKPSVDPTNIPYDSERLVYIALRDQLPSDYVVLHSYPWLRPDRDGNLREGETDFVILHRERGLLVLEVKGGELDYRDAQWRRKKSCGWEEIVDPFAQARKNMHALLKEIEERSSRKIKRWDFAYGYAVVFPHQDYRGAEPSGADPVIIITQPQMGDLLPVIERAFATWSAMPEKLDRDKWTRLLDCVLPSFRLYRPVAADVDAANRQIDELTDEQTAVFRNIYENPRVFVRGIAGSGKTRFALDRALSFARDGKRTLLVCYNKYLAEWLRETTEGAGLDPVTLRNLDIRHFHKLAHELITAAQLEFEVPSQGDAEILFWNETVPDLMEQAVMLLSTEQVQYDAIVMDEGQDFHPRWWECLDYALLRDSSRGPFYAFADPDQSLWDWAVDRPPVPLAVGHRLNHNFRNTRLIADVSARLADVTISFLPRLPVGIPPVIRRVASASAMKGIVQQQLQELISSQHLKSQQIALIGPRRWSNGSLSNTKALAGIPLTDSAARWRKGQGVLVTTARAFKGLEADAVIAYDLLELDSAFSKTDLYVACTRAKGHLCLCITGDTLADTVEVAVQASKNRLL